MGLSFARRSIDPRTGEERRHHMDESTLQKAVREAARSAGLSKPVGPHTLRHSFATAFLQKGYNIRVLQTLLGHKELSTTQIYLHVLEEDSASLTSPADDLPVSCNSTEAHSASRLR